MTSILVTFVNTGCSHIIKVTLWKHTVSKCTYSHDFTILVTAQLWFAPRRKQGLRPCPLSCCRTRLALNILEVKLITQQWAGKA